KAVAVAVRCIAGIAVRAVLVPVMVADIPHAFARREVAGCGGEIAYVDRCCRHSHGAAQRGAGDDTVRERFHGTPLVLPHLTMDEARPFPCPMPACGGSVVQSYTILFVRARKIGSRSGSYVRFVDLVNDPALDGGPREDAHES